MLHDTHSKDRAKPCPWPLRLRKEFVMEKVSRRKFAATSAVAALPFFIHVRSPLRTKGPGGPLSRVRLTTK